MYRLRECQVFGWTDLVQHQHHAGRLLWRLGLHKPKTVAVADALQAAQHSLGFGPGLVVKAGMAQHFAECPVVPQRNNRFQFSIEQLVNNWGHEQLGSDSN